MAEVFLGTIQPFGFNFAPRGWALCQGQLLSIAQNSALFSLLGTIYGGDGRTTFALPDIRGRSLVGMGNGPGLSDISIGEKGGREQVTLTNNNLPSHNHVATATSTLYAETAPGTVNNPTGRMIGGHAGFVDPNPSADVALGSDSVKTTVTVSNTGGQLPFDIRNPFLGINYSIALQGIFPPRN